MIRVDEGEDLSRRRDSEASPAARARGQAARASRLERDEGGFEAATRSYRIARGDSSRTTAARTSRGVRGEIVCERFGEEKQMLRPLIKYWVKT